STLGIIVGAIAANVFRPGDGLHASVESTPSGAVAAATAAADRFTLVNFLLNIIPANPIDAFARGDILQILFVSLLVGIALNMTAREDSVIRTTVGEGQAILFKMLGFVMYVAPVGAFGAMAAAVGGFGAATLIYL